MEWLSRILKRLRADFEKRLRGYIAAFFIVLLVILFILFGLTVPDETTPPPDETTPPPSYTRVGDGYSEETIEVLNTIEIRRSGTDNYHVYTIPDETKIISESNVEEYFVSPTENSIVFFRSATRDHGATLYTIPEGNQIDEVTIGVYEVQFSPLVENEETNGVVLLRSNFNSPDDAAHVYSLPDGGDQIAEITSHVLEVKFSPAGNAVGLLINNSPYNFGAFVYRLPDGGSIYHEGGGLEGFLFDYAGQNVILDPVGSDPTPTPINN